MTTQRLSRLAGSTLLLLNAVLSPPAIAAGQEAPREVDSQNLGAVLPAGEVPEDETRQGAAVEPVDPPSLEDVARRVRDLEELVVLAALAERVARLERRAADPGLETRAAADSVADLARRVQRLEMKVDPITDSRQVDSRIRTIENRLSRVESALRSIRPAG